MFDFLNQDGAGVVSPNANPWWGATQPSTSDGGIDYGAAVLDVFKFGVGILATRNQAEWEDDRRYELAQNGIALQGQAAAVAVAAQRSGSGSLSDYMPLLLIGGAVIVAVFLISD